jgi:hypothetical protein
MKVALADDLPAAAKTFSDLHIGKGAQEFILLWSEIAAFRGKNRDTQLAATHLDRFQGAVQQGVPAPVIMAMIQRYGELQRQTGMAARVPVQVPAAAPAPQYYSYAPEEPASSYPYVEAPSYPVYEPVYYDSVYYPWCPIVGPVVSGFVFGHVGGFGHGGLARGGFGGRAGGGGHVGGRR